MELFLLFLLYTHCTPSLYFPYCLHYFRISHHPQYYQRSSLLWCYFYCFTNYSIPSFYIVHSKNIDEDLSRVPFRLLSVSLCFLYFANFSSVVFTKLVKQRNHLFRHYLQPLLNWNFYSFRCLSSPFSFFSSLLVNSSFSLSDHTNAASLPFLYLFPASPMFRYHQPKLFSSPGTTFKSYARPYPCNFPHFLHYSGSSIIFTTKYCNSLFSTFE